MVVGGQGECCSCQSCSSKQIVSVPPDASQLPLCSTSMQRVRKRTGLQYGQGFYEQVTFILQYTRAACNHSCTQIPRSSERHALGGSHARVLYTAVTKRKQQSA